MIHRTLAVVILASSLIPDAAEAQQAGALANSDRACPRHVQVYCGTWTVRDTNFEKKQANLHMMIGDEFEIIGRGRGNRTKLWLVPDGDLDLVRWKNQAPRLEVIEDRAGQQYCLAAKVEISNADHKQISATNHKHARDTNWHQVSLIWDQMTSKLYFYWSDAVDNSKPTFCTFHDKNDMTRLLGTGDLQGMVKFDPLHGGRAHAN